MQALMGGGNTSLIETDIDNFSTFICLFIFGFDIFNWVTFMGHYESYTKSALPLVHQQMILKWKT